MAQPGTFVLRAVAYDRAGAQGVSPVTNLQVEAPPPAVLARFDVIAQPAPTATLTATPGLGLVPFASVISWQTDGAGSVAVAGPQFSSAEASGAETLSFTASGSYAYPKSGNRKVSRRRYGVGVGPWGLGFEPGRGL